MSINKVNEDSDSMESIDLAGSVSDKRGQKRKRASTLSEPFLQELLKLLISPSPSPVLADLMEEFFHGLRWPSSLEVEVRKLLCAVCVKLIQVRPSVLEPHLPDVIACMVEAIEDKGVATEACRFWFGYFKSGLPKDDSAQYFHRLIWALVKHMAYADDDEFNAEVDDLRKCSSEVLDALSTLPMVNNWQSLVMELQVKLVHPATTWKDKEAAVLALGSVAEGCTEVVYPCLTTIVDCLIPLLADDVSRIKCISCWALSRLSKYIVQADRKLENGQFSKVLKGLLTGIASNDKGVQEAASSAFVKLEEEAQEKLGPHLLEILQCLGCAFRLYKGKNFVILCDAIATLADAVDAELYQAHYLQILMPPLVEKLKYHSDEDLFPLLECLTSISKVWGIDGYVQKAFLVFNKCMKIILDQQNAKANPATAGVRYEKRFIKSSLSLLSEMAIVPGSRFKELQASSNLITVLLPLCTRDYDMDVQQCAFTLVGDLVKVYPKSLSFKYYSYFKAAASLVYTSTLQDNDSISAANSACWALGEIALKVRPMIEMKDGLPKTILSIMARFKIIFDHQERVISRRHNVEMNMFNKSLIENSAITLGKLGLTYPEIVAPTMSFWNVWCAALSNLSNGPEKEVAFRGLCALVAGGKSPRSIPFDVLRKAVASLDEIRDENLCSEVCRMLKNYKHDNKEWTDFVLSLNPALFNILVE